MYSNLLIHLRQLKPNYLVFNLATDNCDEYETTEETPKIITTESITTEVEVTTTEPLIIDIVSNLTELNMESIILTGSAYLETDHKVYDNSEIFLLLHKFVIQQIV